MEGTEKRNKESKENIRYLPCDFTDELSTQRFLQELDRYDRIDACVNNAGINIVEDFLDSSLDNFLLMNQINLLGPYRLLQTVGKKMTANRYGRIVNMASIWSVNARPGRSMYTTTKSALAGLTKALSVEWAQHNVLINAVSPGFTLTELTAKTNTKEQLAELEDRIPMKRMCTKEAWIHLLHEP